MSSITSKAKPIIINDMIAIQVIIQKDYCQSYEKGTDRIVESDEK